MAESGWKTLRLGDFVTLQRGHDLPDHQRQVGSVPVLGSFGITGFHDTARAKGPGVTVGRSGASFGVVSYTEIDYWPLNTALYVIDFHGNDPRFAYYFLKSFDFSSYNSGSAQPSLNRNHIHPVAVTIPAATEQKRIASLLGALDDKIDLNRRMNETLESMARAIFKSWFVDFDPVRAKAEGRQPAGMDAETAALFPDTFTDGCPAGWSRQALLDVAAIVMGQSPPGETYNTTGEGIPFFQGATDFGFRYPTNRVFCTAPTRFAEAGDVLMSVRAPVGRLNIAAERCAIGRGVAGFRSRSGHNSFLYYLLRETESGWEKFDSEGTVFGSVSRSDVEEFSFLHPGDRLAAVFNDRVAAMDDLVRLDIDQTLTLATLRDTLLPKLLSGEIRIGDAEKAVEAHV